MRNFGKHEMTASELKRLQHGGADAFGSFAPRHYYQPIATTTETSEPIQDYKQARRAERAAAWAEAGRR